MSLDGLVLNLPSIREFPYFFKLDLESVGIDCCKNNVVEL